MASASWWLLSLKGGSQGSRASTSLKCSICYNFLRELRRINLPKLFGNSEWVPNRGYESGQKGKKECRSAASCRQRSALETPSAIFQTVSPRISVDKGKVGALGVAALLGVASPLLILFRSGLRRRRGLACRGRKRPCGRSSPRAANYFLCLRSCLVQDLLESVPGVFEPAL